MERTSRGSIKRCSRPCVSRRAPSSWAGSKPPISGRHCKRRRRAAFRWPAGIPRCADRGREGDEAEFARVRADDYQKAAGAELLNLRGWQLIDELNRARAGQPASGYVAPPRLITRSDAPNGPVFDPDSGYRKHYLHIWHP